MPRAGIAIVLSMWCAVAPAAETVGPPPDLGKRIEAYLAPFAEAGQLSGTVLVARNGEVLFERAYGMANQELGVRNTPRTKYSIASINKPITIAVVCQLAEEGKLAQGDPVSKWIPDFPRGDKITISHLLNHRAGIAHRVTTTEQESQPLSAAEMVERVEHSELLFEPGERSIYSSAGFSVLARIVELIEGRPYGEVLEQRIFRRAGMEHSVDPGFHRLVPDRATSYTPAVGGVLNTDLKDLSFLVGAGSVYSTAGDLHRLIGAVLSGTLGQAAQIALMRDEGLRWNGVTNGYSAFADYYKDTGLEVIFTGNLHTGAVDRLREDLPKIVAGEAVAPPVVPRVEAVRVDERVLRRYEGRYESERGQSFSMHVRGGELFAGDRLLVPLSETTFYSLQEYGRVNVVFGEAGRVERLDWEWNGAFQPWRRTGEAED
jgi:CubicO group peptidase (beta-lactamase class C family)